MSFEQPDRVSAACAACVCFGSVMVTWVWCTTNIQISFLNARLNTTWEILLGVRNVSLTLCCMILYSSELLLLRLLMQNVIFLLCTINMWSYFKIYFIKEMRIVNQVMVAHTFCFIMLRLHLIMRVLRFLGAHWKHTWRHKNSLEMRRDLHVQNLRLWLNWDSFSSLNFYTTW